MSDLTISDAVGAESVLLNEDMVPPPPARNLGSGPTAALRSEMARFAAPEAHRSRRAAVERACRLVAAQATVEDARRRTTIVLDRRRSSAIDALADIGFVVPVDVVASALGCSEDTLPAIRSDVETIARVIGRGAPSTEQSDDASVRLVEHLRGSSTGPVAAVSLLYQTHDATAALLGTSLVADRDHTARQSAISTTERVALTRTEIGHTVVEARCTITVDLETAGFEYGLGAHACPGRWIAERLVAGMVTAIKAERFEINLGSAAWHENGRPASLPLRPVED